MLSIIVAYSNNNVIGRDNKIPWDLPKDREFFKNKTINHTIIMGRKTFESLKHVLKNRQHIILTKNKNFNVCNENVFVIHDVSEILNYIKSKEEVFVIGGEQIYKLLMPYVEKIYITRIYKDYKGDTYFPKIDKKEWKIINRKIGTKDCKNNLNYEYFELERI